MAIRPNPSRLSDLLSRKTVPDTVVFFATNVIYFWTDPLAVLQELRRVMKPGGHLALYVISKEDIGKFKVTQTGVYHLYSGDELVQVLTQSGFRQARFVTKAERFRTGICALAEK